MKNMMLSWRNDSAHLSAAVGYWHFNIYDKVDP